ncbi:THAP domain-containing protein 9 [Plakobranchus ocellatus]|uniref:THAP domain-containing protein 9 n=1 Tax=Plakobranchus ocellatus TaxID=259542 RepID=A0AAV3YC30_9GAST|nr:THAP domain-containing protein 9 [Plakobranchus ocellatus]
MAVLHCMQPGQVARVFQEGKNLTFDSCGSWTMAVLHCMHHGAGKLALLICHFHRRISKRLVESGRLKYLLPYKFSQDHLEIFFRKIRRRGEWNDNPILNRSR